MRYANAENTVIQDDNRSIPVNPDNRHYQEIVKSDVTIDPYVAPRESYIDKRLKNLADGGYGTVNEQLEMMSDSGFDAWQAHVMAVKVAHPKP